MAVNIFITGVTGYIGGDALYALHAKYPNWNYSALVRDEVKGKKVKEAYPSVRLVLGSLDDSKVLEAEAAKADIVLHMADASDHVGAANAIARGLEAGHTKEHPGYWLHTGGTGILSWEDTKNKSYGKENPRVYNDWDGVEELTHLPEDAFHRNVDEIVLAAGAKNPSIVKTALVCPPTIYGKGRGPVSTRSRQAYVLANLTLRTGKAPIIGAGQSRWNHVHIYDLSDLYVLLAEAAVAHKSDPDLWGEKGYYLADNGEHVWGGVSKAIGRYAFEKGYIKSAEVEPLSVEAGLKEAGFEAVSWGLNSRGRALRAKKLLGWNPHQPSLIEAVPEIVEREWASLKAAAR